MARQHEKSNTKHIESKNSLTSDEDIEAISRLMCDTVEKGLYPSRLYGLIEDLKQQNIELTNRTKVLEQQMGITK
jgi:hypothetical protein